LPMKFSITPTLAQSAH